MRPTSVILKFRKNRADVIAECYVLGSGLKYDFCGCLLREDMSLAVKTIKDLCGICEGISGTCKLFCQGNSLVLYASNPNFESK